ncbi:MAG TPA: tRNA (adenosine(37)-N6)-dimethylallyltransferase MiaA [Oligoflexus sp.]|uniref:tRNA (adenosine(37)-N6)-dimethylallyltransferase MiaA n=1 Tax=Oligoflexus sp. TaxID=1971216 RepID=UPI002D6A2E23|nr:tRNA (adenosine(37)-N6)-dimethylallyltransferase MiaA [Oligoflexus sp.]HYX32230.1 tRNA (adenosine(37)-N6)-dimethylallyltransferase MiaA [Oligoflexus sp.]
MSSPQQDYLVIAGPTASGKSALAMELAQRLRGEIINCDSVQLYRGFDIGSAKPSVAEQALVPHHLLDVVNADENYDASCFAEAAEALIQDIRSRDRLPLVVGGTGLYLRALWRDNWHDLPKSESLRQELETWSNDALHERLQTLDPARAAQLHRNDRYRLQRAVEIAMLTGKPLSEQTPKSEERNRAFAIRVLCPRPILEERSQHRVEQMLKGGLIEEVRQLLASGVDPQSKPMQSIGYAQVVRFLSGQIKEAELPEQIQIATRQYAKRQETWFKKVHFDATWISGSPIDPLFEILRNSGF